MSQWDWIQWYYFVMCSIGLLANLILHGQPKQGHYDFRYYFVGLILGAPIMGRLFGLW